MLYTATLFTATSGFAGWGPPPVPTPGSAWDSEFLEAVGYANLRAADELTAPSYDVERLDVEIRSALAGPPACFPNCASGGESSDTASTGVVCSTTGADGEVTMQVTDGVRRVAMSGCSPYDWTDQGTPNPATPSAETYDIPTTVKICTVPSQILPINGSEPLLGSLGVALDGVAIYGPTDGEYVSAGSDAKGRDAVVFEGASLGSCGQHANPLGVTHYHAHPGVDPNAYDLCTACDASDVYNCNHKGLLCPLPVELDSEADVKICTKTGGVADWYSGVKPGQFGTATDAQAGDHSPLLGFYFDGVPLYGFFNSDGNTPDDLDSCNGHFSDLGFYHYHAASTYPYMAGCMQGLPTMDGRLQPCSQNGVERVEDYSAVLPDWKFSQAVAAAARETSSRTVVE